jgi:heme/copper-type cytochrome/quinol oxidase subunit 2
MDGPRTTAAAILAGVTLAIALVAIALSLLVLASPPAPRPATEGPPTTVDLSLLITGRGAIGGSAESHLYDPQLIVVRRGDRLRLRVVNDTFFRHGIEIVGYGVRTAPLAAGGTSTVLEFTADRAGIFEYQCYLPYDPATGTCAPDHAQMVGHLVVLETGGR